MRLHSVGEGWLIALEQLRANKARSGLTVLGVVIGIATVMAMASIVSGFRQQIVQTLEVVGPTTFRVLRFFSQTPVNPDALPREIRQRPVLKPEEAEAIARLPEIHYAAIWTQLFHRSSTAASAPRPSPCSARTTVSWRSWAAASTAAGCSRQPSAGRGRR